MSNNKLTQRIKDINLGMALAKRANGKQPAATIYAGTEEFVDFFKTVIAALGLDIEYKVLDVDGVLEIIVE